MYGGFFSNFDHVKLTPYFMRTFLKIVVVLALILGVAFLWFRSSNLKKSPPDTAYIKTDSLYVKVFYCRPYAKNRVIFGDASQNPLLPYGQYWRLGANEATKIVVNRDVVFGDDLLPKGEYILYAYPGSEEFEIVVNSEVGRWGYFDADKTKDLFSTYARANKSDKFFEQFTIEFTQMPDGALMEFMWTDLKWTIPIQYRALNEE
jgi:hypothetical protein